MFPAVNPPALVNVIVPWPIAFSAATAFPVKLIVVFDDKFNVVAVTPPVPEIPPVVAISPTAPPRQPGVHHRRRPRQRHIYSFPAVFADANAVSTVIAPPDATDTSCTDPLFVNSVPFPGNTWLVFNADPVVTKMSPACPAPPVSSVTLPVPPVVANCTADPLAPIPPAVAVSFTLVPLTTPPPFIMFVCAASVAFPAVAV